MRRAVGAITLGVLLGTGSGGAMARPAPASTAQAPAAPRGSIQGVVTTAAKPPRPIRVTFDQRVCGDELPDQALIVDGAGHVANTVITLVGVKAAAPPRTVTVLNDRCAFVPRVQIAGSAATLRTTSKDPVLHTTTVQSADGRQLFNLALPVPGLELSKPLAGTGPLRVGCSTHQWMRGWIFVTDEIAVVTGSDGQFRLPDLPAGTYRLRVWHETLKAADQTVTVVAGKALPVRVELR